MTKKVPKGFEKIIQYWKCKKAYERKGKGKKIMITSLGTIQIVFFNILIYIIQIIQLPNQSFKIFTVL